jgi:hypothetical protein
MCARRDGLNFDAACADRGSMESALQRVELRYSPDLDIYELHFGPWTLELQLSAGGCCAAWVGLDDGWLEIHVGEA